MPAFDDQRVAEGAQRNARIEARVDQVIADAMRTRRQRWCGWCGIDLPAGRYVPWCSPKCRAWLKKDAALQALTSEGPQ